MRYFVGIGLIVAFSFGLLAGNLINANKCLVQNVTLNALLELGENEKTCWINNVSIKGPII